jgi:hypothetical protein
MKIRSAGGNEVRGLAPRNRKAHIIKSATVKHRPALCPLPNLGYLQITNLQDIRPAPLHSELNSIHCRGYHIYREM